MLTSLVLLLYTQVAPYLWDTKGSASKKFGEDPKTLLGLLERAARLWPNHGIAFKDQGWDQRSDFLTYAELMREATVKHAVDSWHQNVANKRRRMPPNSGPMAPLCRKSLLSCTSTHTETTLCGFGRWLLQEAYRLCCRPCPAMRSPWLGSWTISTNYSMGRQFSRRNS
ncbi:hypothetical protein MPH_08682 [Macrophomina phaseolina MS6]|uniref:Uncharacterized protein n=1 Tax=Macrophomina phaseolina (strain MS6) TaxID=1126212 RepID=K2QWI0_MACPH|nr:hypothetical protein MPH_08682 [Macrophomina phaseolina MS6]